MPTLSRLRLGAAALALSLGASAHPLRAADPAPAPHAPAGQFSPPVVEMLRTQKEPEATNLTGRVVDASTVVLGDGGERHRVAWVRDDRGAVRPVDLGPADGDAARAVKVGDKLTVTGQNFPVVQTRKAEMLFASRVKVGDKTVAVGPAGQGGKSQKTGQQKPQALAGKVLRTKRVEWKGNDRRELVILVKTEGGKEVPADLGPTTAFQGAGVRTGEDITLRGQYVKLGDKEVFFADEVVRGGKAVAINRNVPKREAAPGATAQKPAPKLPNSEDNRHVLDGVVRAVRDVPRKDGGVSLVVLLEGPDHRFAYADLGNASAPGKPALVAGDELTVSGPVVHVQKKPLILADSWSMGGKTHWIKR
jgi:hypothetical protein